MAPTSDNTQGFAVWSSGFSDECGKGVTVCGSVVAGGSASVWLCPRSQGHGAEAAAAAVRGRSALLGALRQPWQQQRQRGWQEKASKVVAVRNVREEVSDLSAPVLSFHGGYNPLPLLGHCPPALAFQGSRHLRDSTWPRSQCPTLHARHRGVDVPFTALASGDRRQQSQLASHPARRNEAVPSDTYEMFALHWEG